MASQPGNSQREAAGARAGGTSAWRLGEVCPRRLGGERRIGYGGLRAWGVGHARVSGYRSSHSGCGLMSPAHRREGHIRNLHLSVNSVNISCLLRECDLSCLAGSGAGEAPEEREAVGRRRGHRVPDRCPSGGRATVETDVSGAGTCLVGDRRMDSRLRGSDGQGGRRPFTRPALGLARAATGDGFPPSRELQAIRACHCSSFPRSLSSRRRGAGIHSGRRAPKRDLYQVGVPGAGHQ